MEPSCREHTGAGRNVSEAGGSRAGGILASAAAMGIQGGPASIAHSPLDQPGIRQSLLSWAAPVCAAPPESPNCTLNMDNMVKVHGGLTGLGAGSGCTKYTVSSTADKAQTMQG